MAVCRTHALQEWIATALQMDPGNVAHARSVSVETVPSVKTLMRYTLSLFRIFIWRCDYLFLHSTDAFFSSLLLLQCDMVSDVCYKVSGTQRCVNTNPGFHCLPCPKRYKGTQPFGIGVESAKKNKQVSWSNSHSASHCWWDAIQTRVTLEQVRSTCGKHRDTIWASASGPIFKSSCVDFCMSDPNLWMMEEAGVIYKSHSCSERLHSAGGEALAIHECDPEYQQAEGELGNP